MTIYDHFYSDMKTTKHFIEFSLLSYGNIYLSFIYTDVDKCETLSTCLFSPCMVPM